MSARQDSRNGRVERDGVLVVDKPAGLTSHDVVAAARRLLNQRGIGHTGTLDPLATGVLPLACGRATRLIRFLGADTKEYEAVVRFGVTSDTYDVTGTVTEPGDACPTREQIETALAALRGTYLQTPPAFSAKKVGGRRAYALAREHQAVTLAPVPVEVTRAEILRLDGTQAVFAIACSAGFYVRTFAHRLGELTGAGACLEALRRTRSGGFTLASAVTLEQLAQRAADGDLPIVPLPDLLPHLPSMRLSDEGLRRVAHGREVVPARTPADAGAAVPPSSGPSAGHGGWVKMLAPDGSLAAVGRAAGDGALHPAIVLI